MSNIGRRTSALQGGEYVREVAELQEGDIPIGYHSFLSGYLSSSGAGGQQVVRQVVVLRPIK